MKFLTWRKDGGPESHVTGFFVVEIKSLFSIVLLRFANGSRDAYHSHAFNTLSWVLRGRVHEITANPEDFWAMDAEFFTYTPSFRPVWTPRNRMHKVISHGTTWVLSFRGPWANTWEEFVPAEDRFVTLTHGRKEV